MSGIDARLSGPAALSMYARPRVTMVMKAAGLSPDYVGVPADVLAAASARGTVIHGLIADAHLGSPERHVQIPIQLHAAYDSSYIGPWNAYCAFCDDTGHEPLYSELLVEHPQWQYIGHLDRIGWINRRRALFDWKVTHTLDVEAVAIQLAAYRMAWNVMHPQEPVHACFAVQLRVDGTYRLQEVDADQAEPIWQAALVLYYARLKMGRIGPWLGL